MHSAGPPDADLLACGQIVKRCHTVEPRNPSAARLCPVVLDPFALLGLQFRVIRNLPRVDLV